MWGLIFGSLLIVWGLSHITETLFHIHVPIFGVVFGIFLLYIGFQLISGGFRRRCWCTHDDTICNQTCASETHLDINDANIGSNPLSSYKTVMGRTTIDMTRLTKEAVAQAGNPLIMYIDTVFGQTTLKLNKIIPVKIIVKGGFANVTTPDGSSVVFGSHSYTSHPNEQPMIIIYTSTSFGQTTIISQ